jgi:hypothetical protein
VPNCLHSSVSSVAVNYSDIWSGNANEDYFSVVHYVNAAWDLNKRIIGL